MYNKTLKHIDLTDDEVDIIKELLFYRLEQCVSIGEEITVRELLEKLENRKEVF